MKYNVSKYSGVFFTSFNFLTFLFFFWVLLLLLSPSFFVMEQGQIWFGSYFWISYYQKFWNLILYFSFFFRVACFFLYFCNFCPHYLLFSEDNTIPNNKYPMDTTLRFVGIFRMNPKKIRNPNYSNALHVAYW